MLARLAFAPDDKRGGTVRPSTPALGVLALTGGLLVGCGDDDPAATGADDASISSGDRSVGSGSAGAFCDEADALQERFRSFEDGTDATPELFQEVSDAFEELSGEAPAEISDDMATVASALASFAELFAELDPDDPESLAILEEEAERLAEETDRLAEAGENVETYFSEECGIDLDGQETPTGSEPDADDQG